MATNSLKLLRSIKTDIGLDNLKYDHNTGKLYTAGLSKLADGLKFSPEPKPNAYFSEVYSAIIEVDVGLFDQPSIQRNLVMSNKIMMLSNGLRMGKYVIAGSPVYDGILVCPIDENTESIQPNENLKNIKKLEE